MPRKGLVFRRPQATDPVYDSDIVEKFICSMMYEGKKSTAQSTWRAYATLGSRRSACRDPDRCGWSDWLPVKP